MPLVVVQASILLNISCMLNQISVDAAQNHLINTHSDMKLGLEHRNVGI